MIAIFLIPIYLLVNFYILRWILRWMGACTHYFKKKWIRGVLIGLYAFVASSLALALFIKEPSLHRLLKQISNVYLGAFLYILLTIVFVDIIRLILKKTKWIAPEVLSSRKTFVTTGTICMVLILSVSIYGIVHAKKMYTTSYTVSVPKTMTGEKQLKIALISDLHLGYSIGNEEVERMTAKINAMEPDIVCLAGDIFDNEYDAIKDPEKVIETLKGIKSRYGVYACWGNHDVSETILAGFTFDSSNKNKTDTRMEDFLTAADIQLLNDETTLIDNRFYLVGRKDYSRAKKVEPSRQSPQELLADLDKSKPILVIDHQPKELQELADAGADLDMSGHTHNGQVFPGNLTIGLMWENACGYLQKDNMASIVTSGAGVWGPNMRVGTNSEVVEINVQFQ